MLCFAGRIAAEPTLQFLLESDAVYELRFTFPSQMDKSPPLLTIYTVNDEGSVLNMVRLYRGLTFHGTAETSVIFEAPEGYSRAEVEIIGAENPEQTSLTMTRLDRLDPDQRLELLDMIINQEIYTGLIVDARGLGLERGMSPRIWSESGEMIYGGVAASYDYVQHSGVASYGTQLSEELKERLSIRSKLSSFFSPLIVKAQGVKGQPRTGVILDQATADRIIAAIQNYDFFAHYAVVFLVD